MLSGLASNRIENNTAKAGQHIFKAGTLFSLNHLQKSTYK